MEILVEKRLEIVPGDNTGGLTFYDIPPFLTHDIHHDTIMFDAKILISAQSITVLGWLNRHL